MVPKLIKPDVLHWPEQITFQILLNKVTSSHKKCYTIQVCYDFIQPDPRDAVFLVFTSHSVSVSDEKFLSSSNSSLIYLPLSSPPLLPHLPFCSR